MCLVVEAKENTMLQKELSRNCLWQTMPHMAELSTLCSPRKVMLLVRLGGMESEPLACVVSCSETCVAG